MVISDLEHLEVTSEQTNVVGGGILAIAIADAFAKGTRVAITNTYTYTLAFHFEL